MLELNRIYCTDCVEGMRQLEDESVDAVVTDPPYGFNRFKGDEPELFIAIIADAFREIKRILKPNHWAFVFSGTGAVSKLMDAVDMEFQRMLWMYKPADCTFPYRGWLLKSEAILLFTNGVTPHPLSIPDIYAHDCYIVNKIGKEIGCNGHPAVKPIQVIRDLVRRVDGVVLDPFMGSGTTAVACKQLGRRYIGFEISPEYCAIAEKRLKQERITRWF